VLEWKVCCGAMNLRRRTGLSTSLRAGEGARLYSGGRPRRNTDLLSQGLRVNKHERNARAPLRINTRPSPCVRKASLQPFAEEAT
jgi:hypothetical protein